MSEPPQPFRPAGPVNPYEGVPSGQAPATPQPVAAWPAPAVAPSEHPDANTVLLLGIVGLFIPLAAPAAFFIGNGARADVAAGRFAPSTTLTVGWVLGLVMSVLLVLAIALGGLAIVGLLAFRA